MRGRVLTVALATALMTTTALPAAADNRYEAGFVKTVDHTSLERRSDDLYRVGRGGHGDRDRHRGDRGRHRGRGHHRGDRGHRHRHHGYRGRHGHFKPRYRSYSRPYRPYRYNDRYYYDDALGAFILGSTLGYILSQ